MGGDGKHRNAAAVAVEQSVDQVQITGAAAAAADGKFAGQMGLRAGGEGGTFLMAHMDPFDGFQTPQRVGETI